jgi:hypothetical protein
MPDDSTHPYIKPTARYLLVELPRGDVTQVAEIDRELAVMCIKQQIARCCSGSWMMMRPASASRRRIATPSAICAGRPDSSIPRAAAA